MESKKAFIYTGGTVYDTYVLEKPKKGDLLIAADAGYLTARRMGLTPDILVGDLDTLGELPEMPDTVEVIRLPEEKDLTDTQYAVGLALERGATELVIIGGLEGRLDHTLSLLAILEELWERGEIQYGLFGRKKTQGTRVPAVITNGKNRVRFFRSSGTILPGGDYRYFSLIAADKTVSGITLEGCKYPLQNAKLHRRRQWAVSNEVVGNCALIEVRRGGVWVVESRD